MSKLDVRKKLLGNGGIPFRPIQGRARARQLIERLIDGWSTTPGKFRVARATLVSVLLAATAVGGYVVNIHADAAQDIADRTGPLSMDATELYRSMADANATVTSGFLSGGAEPADLRELYDIHIPDAAARLTDAAARTGDDRLATNRIADIGAQLPAYTGLVERARAANRPGSSTGAGDLQIASDLMQTTIQPAAQLQRIQAKRLDGGYQRVGSVPAPALVLFVVSLAGLVWAQIVVFRRTKRVFNVGLVVSTLAVVGTLLWWTVASVAYHGYLADSRRHSQSVTAALGLAQIAAQQARAGESLALLARGGGATGEARFSAEMEILARDDGAGGALGAAQAFASDDHGRMLVQSALVATRGYLEAHDQVRKLNEAGKHDEAVAAAVGAGDTSAAAFSRLDEALTTAVKYERTEFDSDLARARGVLGGLLVGTVLLMLTAVTGVIWGIRQRMREYP